MNWKYCPFCGGELLKKPLMQLCSQCGKQHYENPKSTVGVFLFDSNGRIILAIRKIDPYKGYWDTIGGFVSIGESLEEAAYREFSEETGCRLGSDATPPEYLASAYIEVEFMGYTTPVNTIMFCSKLLKDNLQANDDVAGFMRLHEHEYESEKMAWSDKMTPLIQAAFEWFKKQSS